MLMFGVERKRNAHARTEDKLHQYADEECETSF